MLHFLNSIQPFSIDLWQHLAIKVEIHVVKKKVFLLKAGQISSRMFFIESGSILCYRRIGDKKIVSGLRKEGDFLIPADSFYSQSRSTEYFMTLEEGTLCTINYNDLQAVYRDFPEFNTHMRVLAELNARFNEEFLHILRNHSAHTRYMWLPERFPDLVKRIPTKYLASYIGMTVQSFTRVKRELVNPSIHSAGRK